MLQPEFDLPSPIDVFRDSPTNERPRLRFNDAQRDAREQRIQELGERVRDAVVRQRVAEAVGERLEGALKERVREVLRSRFMRDVRSALRDVAMAKSDPDDVGELLDDAFSDIIEDRVRDVLREQLGTAVRERASDAIRSALADASLTGNLSPEAADELVDALETRMEDSVRDQLRDGLQGAAKLRIREIAHQRLVDALRQAVDARGQVNTEIDRILAPIGDRIETTLQDHVTDALRERFRAILSNTVSNISGDRVRDALRHTGLRAFIEGRRGGGGTPRRGEDWGRFEGRLRRNVEDRIRSRLADGLRDHLEFTTRETLNAALKERLGVAMRRAIAEQRGERLDARQLAASLSYELGDALALRLSIAFTRTINDWLRTRLADAIESGVGELG